MTGLYNIGIGGGIVAVMVYGGKLVYNGEMSNGDLTTFMLYSRTLQQSLITLSILQGELTKALGAAERVLYLLRRFSIFIDFCWLKNFSVPDIPVVGGEIPKTPVKGSIAFENVSFSYPSRPHAAVLKDVSVTLEEGKVYALVGPSGSGKSTKVNHISDGH